MTALLGVLFNWRTLIGLALATAIVWPLALTVGKVQGRIAAQANFRAGVAESALQETRRQRDAERTVKKNERARNEQLQSEVTSLRAKAASLATELADQDGTMTVEEECRIWAIWGVPCRHKEAEE